MWDTACRTLLWTTTSVVKVRNTENIYDCTVFFFFFLTLITEFLKFISHLNQKMRTAKVIQLWINTVMSSCQNEFLIRTNFTPFFKTEKKKQTNSSSCERFVNYVNMYYFLLWLFYSKCKSSFNLKKCFYTTIPEKPECRGGECSGVLIHLCLHIAGVLRGPYLKVEDSSRWVLDLSLSLILLTLLSV